jgi:hypothetical protein
MPACSRVWSRLESSDVVWCGLVRRVRGWGEATAQGQPAHAPAPRRRDGDKRRRSVHVPRDKIAALLMWRRQLLLETGAEGCEDTHAPSIHGVSLAWRPGLRFQGNAPKKVLLGHSRIPHARSPPSHPRCFSFPCLFACASVSRSLHRRLCVLQRASCQRKRAPDPTDAAQQHSSPPA